MKTIITMITLYTAVAAFGATAVQDPENWFSTRDFNRDNKISQEEFINCQTEISNSQGKNWTEASMRRRFDSLDKNRDGVIVLDELLPEKKTTKAIRTPSKRSRAQTEPKPFRCDGFRDFLAANGKSSTNAKVIAYDRRRNLVTILKKGSRIQCKVNAGLLTETDRTFIREWEIAKGFHSESQFKISTKRQQLKVESQRHTHEYYGTENKKTTLKQIGYEITLENRTAHPLKNIEIEYCIYYEQERAERGKQITDEGVRYGTLHIGTLAGRSEKSLTTEAVKLSKSELSADWHYYSGAENTQKGKVVGIWLRVHLPLSDGQQVTRQHSLPDSFQKNRTWYTYNVSAGMNRR